MKNWLKNLIRSSEPGVKVSVEQALRRKYEHFQHFLAARKRALAALGLSPPPDSGRISEDIAEVIHALNVLSEQRSPDLLPMLREIEGRNGEIRLRPEEDSRAQVLQTPWPLQPESCHTFRDLLTCAHDLAIEEMFTILGKYDIRQGMGKKIRTGLPINLHVIDLGGGLTPGGEARLLPREQILSLPMQAMFRGMYYPGVTWSGPIGINLKGLMVIMAQSTSRPEEDFWDKTYEVGS